MPISSIPPEINSKWWWEGGKGPKGERNKFWVQAQIVCLYLDQNWRIPEKQLQRDWWGVGWGPQQDHSPKEHKRRRLHRAVLGVDRNKEINKRRPWSNQQDDWLKTPSTLDRIRIPIPWCKIAGRGGMCPLGWARWWRSYARKASRSPVADNTQEAGALESRSYHPAAVLSFNICPKLHIHLSVMVMPHYVRHSLTGWGEKEEGS